MNLDLDKLEQAAAGAMGWSEKIGEVAWYDGPDLFDATGQGLPDADRAFIAAANPAVVLELVRRVKAAEAALDRIRALGEIQMCECDQIADIARAAQGGNHG